MRISSRIMRHSIRARSRAQILVMFPAAFLVLVLMATLALDGAFMGQSQRDLEIVSTHAATAGAQMVDHAYYNANCGPYIKAHTYYLDSTNSYIVSATTPGAIAHTSVASDCNQFLILDPNAASNAARASANNWLNQLANQQMSLPGSLPVGGLGTAVKIKMGPGNKTITVTVEYCYKPFLYNALFDNPQCPDRHSALIVSSFTSDPLAGQ
jgi:hypothetical protein